MSVGFGFSAGDFVAGLNLVKDVIDALREASGAATHYRDLLTELSSLETALLEVKRLDPDIHRPAQLIALQQAASQCQRTIDEFWKKISKFQPHLSIGGSGSKVKDGWKKIQWALCRKEDVATFRAQLRGHTASINTLLMTMQMNVTTIENKKQENRHQSLASQVQQSSFAMLHRLKCIGSGVNSLIETTANIMRTNIQVFQMVLNIQGLITRLPGQIDRQQPVYFTDAFGKVAPFHLEFITSAEAFMAVLKVRHRHAGADKIARREFFLQETSTAQEINIQDSWDTCFQPGQEVDMSMVFGGQTDVGDTCPACLHDCNGCSSAKSLLCPSCKRTFSRVFAFNARSPQTLPFLLYPESGPSSVPTLGVNPEKRKRIGDEIEEITRFRRVRIVSHNDAVNAIAQLNPNHVHETFDDALLYIDKLKVRYSDRPNIYSGFLNILEEFRSQSLETSGVIKAMSLLFPDDPQTLEGFNQFLPPGYSIRTGFQNLELASGLLSKQSITMEPSIISDTPQPTVEHIKPAAGTSELDQSKDTKALSDEVGIISSATEAGKRNQCVWYCGHCSTGPMDIDLDTTCNSCGRRRDDYANIEIL